jgi:hypothetical protein
MHRVTGRHPALSRVLRGWDRRAVSASLPKLASLQKSNRQRNSGSSEREFHQVGERDSAISKSILKSDGILENHPSSKGRES